MATVTNIKYAVKTIGSSHKQHVSSRKNPAELILRPQRRIIILRGRKLNSFQKNCEPSKKKCYSFEKSYSLFNEDGHFFIQEWQFCTRELIISTQNKYSSFNNIHSQPQDNISVLKKLFLIMQ